MDNKWELYDFICSQLDEMVQNVISKHRKNQVNRGNNPFLCFNDLYINAFMGMGRSLNSQLGNRLQKIAFKLAQLKYTTVNVPNLVTLRLYNQWLYIGLSWDDSFSQKLLISQSDIQNLQRLLISQYNIQNYIEVMSVNINVDYFNYLSSLIQNKIIPVDLLFIHQGAFYSFEIKSGGNLDTKNAAANADEVNRLQRIFSIIPDSKSYFATCYNNMGENANPTGSIFKLLPQRILIGQNFWNSILPNNISYQYFINIYNSAFVNVNVEQRLKDII